MLHIIHGWPLAIGIALLFLDSDAAQHRLDAVRPGDDVPQNRSSYEALPGLLKKDCANGAAGGPSGAGGTAPEDGCPGAARANATASATAALLASGHLNATGPAAAVSAAIRASASTSTNTSHAPAANTKGQAKKPRTLQSKKAAAAKATAKPKAHRANATASAKAALPEMGHVNASGLAAASSAAIRGDAPAVANTSHAPDAHEGTTSPPDGQPVAQHNATASGEGGQAPGQLFVRNHTGKALITHQDPGASNDTNSSNSNRYLSKFSRYVSSTTGEADLGVAMVVVLASAIVALAVIVLSGGAMNDDDDFLRSHRQGARVSMNLKQRPSHDRLSRLQPASKPDTPPVSTFDTVPPSLTSHSRHSTPSQALAVLSPHRGSLTSAAAASPNTTGPRPSLSSTPSIPSGPPQTLPPLCPALLMPHCETWLGVAFDRLMEQEGTFGILGVSGTPLLYATKTSANADGAKSIIISLTPSRMPLLATMSGGPGSPPEIRAGSGHPYGVLQPSGNSQYSLVCGGYPVMAVMLDVGSGKLLMQSVADRAIVGHAARCKQSDYFEHGEHLEVRASPGVDAVLVLCCVLGVLQFDNAVVLPTISRADSSTSLK